MRCQLLARAGALAFTVALLPHWALGAAVAPGTPAAEDGPAPHAAVLAAGSVFELTPDLPPGLVPPEQRVPRTARVRTLSIVAARPTFPPPEPLVTDGVVVASWYGPGFYGNRTACGQTYTPEIMGVAHRTLRCGTAIAITSPRGITLTVAVIDRGPYVAGRSLDLSNATRAALQCSDLCRVHMRVIN